MPKRAQISHLRAIFSGRSVLTKCRCSLRLLICSPMHHIVSNLFYLLIDLFVVLLCLLLKTRLFNQRLVLVHTSANLVWFNHQLLFLLLNLYSERTQGAATFQWRLVEISYGRWHALSLSFSRVDSSWIRWRCFPGGTKLTGSPSSSRLVSTVFITWRNDVRGDISGSIFLKAKYPHKLLKVQFYVTLLLLCMHFKVFKSHYIIPTRPLPGRVTQKHLVLICIYEVGEDLIPEPPLLLNAYVPCFAHLRVGTCGSSLGPLLSPLLEYLYLTGICHLILLLFRLFLLLLSVVLYLVHLLFDLVHAQTLLQRVGLGCQPV